MYDKTILLEILLTDECRTLDNDGKPYPPTAPVYSTISEKMRERDSTISAKHVYVIVRQNRNGFNDLLQRHFNINPIERHEFSDTRDSTNDSINTSGSQTLHSKEFNIVISAEKWQLMKPIKKIYNNHAYSVLQSGRTDIIAEKLWQQQKLDCIISFKKHKVYISNEARCYVYCRGNCVECAATIECILFKMPVDDTDVIFKCKIKNMCSANLHTNIQKRHLKGKRRVMVADIMIKQHKDAITFRRDEAKRLKNFGDKNPPILPSSAVLRKAKEEILLY